MPISYRYNIWSAGEECTVVEYNSEVSPPTEKVLTGPPKTEALTLIYADMRAVSEGSDYKTSKIAEGWYWYNIKPSGRSSWEVKFEDSGKQISSPCGPTFPMPPPQTTPEPTPVDPRSRHYTLSNVTVDEKFEVQPNGVTKVTLTVSGNLPQA